MFQGAVPKGNATRENIMKLGLKEGQVVFKCPKCISIKPERAHHCRYVYLVFIWPNKKRVSQALPHLFQMPLISLFCRLEKKNGLI